MKMLHGKNLVKFVFLALIAGIFAFTGCESDSDSKTKEVSVSESIVNGLISQLTTGEYKGKVKKVKLKKGTEKVTITWENPTDDDKFCGVNVYLDGNPTPVAQYDKDDEGDKELIVEGLEEGKRYTFTIFAMGNENGKEVNSLNPWYGSIRIGDVDVTNYDFIGYGYDAITGEYFSEGGVKNRILDFDDDYKPEYTEMNSSDIKYSSGTSFIEYKKAFNVSVGVEAEFAGFGGSVESSFSQESASSEEHGFASAYGNYKKAKEYLTPAQAKITVLKDHLDVGFMSDINDDTISPAQIFEDYGTHVMISTTVGGRFVMNFDVKKTSTTTSQSIEAAAKASYGGVSGSTSTGSSSESSSATENMTITGYSRGGKSISFSSAEQAQEQWAAWTDSLEDSKYWSLVDAENIINKEGTNTGIWLFANDEARQEEIYNYYKEQLAKNSEAIANYCKPTYIKDVKIYVDTSDLGWDGIYQKIKNLEGKENFVLAGYKAANRRGISYYNLQRDTDEKSDCLVKNQWVYLYYTTTKDEDEAIKGCVGCSGGSESAASVANCYSNLDASQWTRSSADYRKGVSGKWGFFYTSKTQDSTGKTGEEAKYIREIDIYTQEGVSSATQTAMESYELVTVSRDITSGASGNDIYLYLYY